MSKAYTSTDFSSLITADRTWRLKEMSDLKALALREEAAARPVLLRALVALSYAHWEGYVRFSARKFLEHVALRKLLYSQLRPQFKKNLFLPRLAALSRSKAGVAERCNLVDAILDSHHLRYSRANDDLVQTKSNLNFETFSEICMVCGVDLGPFADRSTFIDVVLLKRRNAIAHGEDTFIALIDLDEVVNETTNLMRQFGDALENIVVLEAFKAV